jgi:hypothetical protein
MKKIFTNKLGRSVLYVCAFILITIFGLWSWNTISELFNGPQAQYKHVIAAISLLLITRIFLFQHANSGSFLSIEKHANA